MQGKCMTYISTMVIMDMIINSMKQQSMTL
jgi:hypothetical protein